MNLVEQVFFAFKSFINMFITLPFAALEYHWVFFILLVFVFWLPPICATIIVATNIVNWVKNQI